VPWDGENLGVAVAEDGKTGNLHLVKYENEGGHITGEQLTIPRITAWLPKTSGAARRHTKGGPVWATDHNSVRQKKSARTTYVCVGAGAYVREMSATSARNVPTVSVLKNQKQSPGECKPMIFLILGNVFERYGVLQRPESPAGSTRGKMRPQHD